jgi:hypothetical protein
VCSKGFSDVAANYICNALSFPSSKGWFTGYHFTLQDNLEVSVNDMDCTDSGTSNPCTMDIRGEKCSSNKNIFLMCGEGQCSSNHIQPRYFSVLYFLKIFTLLLTVSFVELNNFRYNIIKLGL